MQKIRIAIVTGMLVATSVGINAAELTVKNSIQGRSGIQTVVRVETEKPTIALSKQGQGIGSKADEERPAKVQWHNPSRPPINVTAHN